MTNGKNRVKEKLSDSKQKTTKINQKLEQTTADTKYKRLPIESIKILNDWYNTYKDINPNPQMLDYLAQKTNLNKQQVATWIKRSKYSKSKNGIPIDKKLSLIDYFNYINKTPNSYEYIELSNQLGLSVLQIKNWFYRQRKDQ